MKASPAGSLGWQPKPPAWGGGTKLFFCVLAEFLHWDAPCGPRHPPPPAAPSPSGCFSPKNSSTGQSGSPCRATELRVPPGGGFVPNLGAVPWLGAAPRCSSAGAGPGWDGNHWDGDRNNWDGDGNCACPQPHLPSRAGLRGCACAPKKGPQKAHGKAPWWAHRELPAPKRLPREFGSLLVSKFPPPRQKGAVKLWQGWVLVFAGAICVPQRLRIGLGTRRTALPRLARGTPRHGRCPKVAQGRGSAGPRTRPRLPGSQTGLKTGKMENFHKMEIPAEKRRASLLRAV